MSDTAQWKPFETCGVEVRGLRLGTATDRDVAEVQQRFAEHGVVFFRDTCGQTRPGEQITQEEHLQFAKKLAPVDINRFFAHVEGYPEIAMVEKKREAKDAIGSGFHSDHTYDLAPAMGSLLVARSLPETGGSTVFVDMRRAYDSLSNDLKAKLEGMRAVHSSQHIFGEGGVQSSRSSDIGNAGAAVQTTVHPVVIVHPESGRKVLFVNPAFTVHFEGQTVEESCPLLKTLYQHSVQAANMTRFEFDAGSAVLWDNRSVWHCAMNDYQGQYRLMHRVTIEGVRIGGSEPSLGVGEPLNAAALRSSPGWARNLRDTLVAGMRNLDPDMEAWWPEAPPIAGTPLKAATFAEVDLSSRL